jgi:hypothetical protein
MPRSVLLLPAVLTVAVLTGCGQPAAPEVTFSVDGRSVRTGPTLYCDIELTECENNDSAVVSLDVPAGQPVRIRVPEAVARAPWQVVFRYRKGSERIDGRSEVFSPGARQEYLLRAPEGGTFQTIEVQQYGAPELGPGGEASFRIRAAWVLATNAER